MSFHRPSLATPASTPPSTSLREEDIEPPPPPTTMTIPSFRKKLFPIPMLPQDFQALSLATALTMSQTRTSTMSPNQEPRKAKSAKERHKKNDGKLIKLNDGGVTEQFKVHNDTHHTTVQSDSVFKPPKHKTSIRFAIGEASIESNLTIAALNSKDFSIFETHPESEVEKQKDIEPFDLDAFLQGLKKPKEKVKNLKSTRVDELKDLIEEKGSIVEGLSKEECLYYIEAFVSIDIDDSGAISETELFEAMDKLNMDFTEDQVREMIKTVDVNGDGDVGVDEFLKLMSNLRSKVTFLQSQEQIDHAFGIVDRDGDRLIGCQDLILLFRDVGEEVTLEQVKRMLQAILGETFQPKKTEDPKISMAHFIKLIKTVGQ